jgi:hypothetical protein
MQLRDQFKAGHFGHLVIGDDEVVILRLKRVPAGGAIRDAFNVVAGASQHSEAKLASVPVVINDEDAAGGTRRAWPWLDGRHPRLQEVVIFHNTVDNNMKTDIRAWGIHPLKEAVGFGRSVSPTRLGER